MATMYTVAATYGPHCGPDLTRHAAFAERDEAVRSAREMFADDDVWVVEVRCWRHVIDGVTHELVYRLTNQYSFEGRE